MIKKKSQIFPQSEQSSGDSKIFKMKKYHAECTLLETESPYIPKRL